MGVVLLSVCALLFCTSWEFLKAKRQGLNYKPVPLKRSIISAIITGVVFVIIMALIGALHRDSWMIPIMLTACVASEDIVGRYYRAKQKKGA